MKHLYMIGMVSSGGAFFMLGVADSLKAAQARVVSECGGNELFWEITSHDNFESLLWLTDWRGNEFSIKNVALIKETT